MRTAAKETVVKCTKTPRKIPLKLIDFKQYAIKNHQAWPLTDIKYPIKSSLFQDVLSRTAFKRLVAKVPNLFRLLMSPSWVLIVKVFIGNILLELDLQDSKVLARQKTDMKL